MQTVRGRSEEPRPRSKSQSQQPRRARSRAASRDSSVSSASREVRCGCQFFQSDSLLPERVNPVGRPASRNSNAMAHAMGDHEYEPIAAPSPKLQEPLDLDLGPDEEFDAIKTKLQSKSETSSTSSRERRFLRIPLDDELVILPGDGEDEDEAMAIKSMEGENGEAKAKQLSVPELQDDRYFTATPTTTESRTDYDVNTSQLDSSGLEDIPLKKEARKKKLQETAEEQAQGRGFQQRLRSQAARVRSKLRNMPRPNIKLPDRPKFNLPERPKFHLPERPKFNLPERPKFNLPDRPKFNLPERPKFNLPERPKFNFPDRSKFHLPERPKFNFPERPKFNLPQRPKISMPSFGIGKDRKDKTRFSSTRRPLRDRSNLSSASTASSSKKNLFDFDFRSYPRIFDKKFRRGEYATSSPKQSRGQTPPPQMPSRKKGRWLQKFSDDATVPSVSEGQSRVTDDLEPEEYREDIDMVEGAESVGGRSESTSAFQDKDFGYAVTIDDERPPGDDERRRMQASSSSVGEARSSGSSSLRHRAGVLEEIDSDEFFLREKGLSQEDVEVGRYLTSEIRDAFRAPISALSHMEHMDNYDYYDDEEDVENLGQQYRSTPDRGPTRPARTRSLIRARKRSSKSKSPAEEEFYKTFPPARPKRGRRGQEEEEQEQQQQQEQEMEVQEIEEPVKREIPSFTVTDEDEQRQQSVEPDLEDQWQTEQEHAVAEPEPPMPPKRLRRSRKEPIPDTLCNGHYTKEDWLENLQAQIEHTEEVLAMRMESDYIIPAAPSDDFELPPDPPRRGRRKSSRATSLADEDRTSRGASSLPSEREHVTDDLPIDLSLPEIPGYACVEKPSTKPRKRTPRPAAPGRRKRSANGHSRSYPHFYSLPHRPPPIRPLRNYSTLGPSRPPRRHKASPAVDLDQKSESYIEIEDDLLEPTSHTNLEESLSARDLQSGDIIERMKGRPLPPPPRPPRKGREVQEEEEEEEEEIDDRLIDGDAPLYRDEEMEEPEELFEVKKEEPLGALSDKVFYAQSGVTSLEDEELEEELPKEEEEALERALLEKKDISPVLSEKELKEDSPVLEEVSVAIQTDPLPDDVCVVTAEDEVAISYANVSTETSPPRTFEFGQQTLPQRAATPPEPIVIEKPIPYYVMPDPDTEVELKATKLQVTELDVERLNVGELQAHKITVSEIDGVTFQVSELSSKSANLVLSGLELPPGFLQELYESFPSPSPQPPIIISGIPASMISVSQQSTPSQPPPPSEPEPVPQDSPCLDSLHCCPSIPETSSPEDSCVHETSSSEVTSVLEASPDVSSAPAEIPKDSSPASLLTSSPEKPETAVQEEPISVFVVEPSVSEQQAPDSATPVPVQEAPVTIEDTPFSPQEAPVTEQEAPIPVQASPVPVQEAPVSIQATPVPVQEAPVSIQATPVPVQEDPIPVQATPVPVQEATVSIQATPVSVQAAPFTTEHTSESVQEAPISVQTTPVPVQEAPAQATPVPIQEAPAHATPVPTQATPVPVQEAPAQATPVPAQATPVPVKEAPAQATPVPVQAIPAPVQASPVPAQAIPLPVQDAPAQAVPAEASSAAAHAIPLHYPNIVTSLDGLHTFIPAVRVPSRPRSQAQRELESEEEMLTLMQTSSGRRRRHHLAKPVARYSSDEEEEDFGAYRPPSRRHHSTSRTTEPTVGELGCQLVHACQGLTLRALNQLVQYVATVREGDDKRRDLQIALCVLLLLVAGLILMGYGSGKTYHTHHWDYHFPPTHP